MNPYFGVRYFRPAGLILFGLPNVTQEDACAPRLRKARGVGLNRLVMKLRGDPD
jgi:hypothetical protein